MGLYDPEWIATTVIMALQEKTPLATKFLVAKGPILVAKCQNFTFPD